MYDTPLETLDYRGHRIELHYDTDPLNPRKEYDNLGKMVCWHRHYDLGDEQPREAPFEYVTRLAALYDEDVYNKLDEMSEGEGDELVRGILNEHYLMLNLYLYDHGGLSIGTRSFSDPWGSGQVGFIYMSKEDAAEEGAEYTEKKALDWLKAEVVAYDKYLRGEVYTTRVYAINAAGDEELVDSCGGYDDDKYAMSEARGFVDYRVEQARKKHLARLKTLIRNHVPLERRPAFSA